jgi:transposase
VEVASKTTILIAQKNSSVMICPVKVRHQSNIYGVFFMAKFTEEEKIQSVLRYKHGNEPMTEIADDIGVHRSVLGGWVRLYEHQGESAFIQSYTSYSTQYKMDVLKYMIEMGTSSVETAAIFNIPSAGMIRSWRLKFEKGGINALISKKKGRLSMKKEIDTNKPITGEGSEESLQAKVERLEMEIAYLKKLNALVQMQEKLQTKSKRK